MKELKIAGLAGLALVALIVVLQNTESIQTRVLFFSFEAPAAVLLFGVGVIGFVLGVAASLLAGRRRRAPPTS